MSKRWAPAPGMGVTLADDGTWLARNEMGESRAFTDHMPAYQWAWSNWELCTACHERRPFHPEYRVCRGCGATWGHTTSVWADHVARLAGFLYSLPAANGTPAWEYATPDYRENYTADAIDVLLALPHLLPLDVREAMIDESEDH